ncbi:glycosyltransferase family 39 protein [Geobacter pickeringii]|uniref:Glycosyl transferase n=1 Tax=Geobacter pickeringii TaxID=345632 RepID=A0A0B5BC30_9BACT|nr:glycosyltransferase family 39 protein [Geobacter pickeringii]AJE04087.1 glycosyl transferase [Geobacter pickeringii]
MNTFSRFFSSREDRPARDLAILCALFCLAFLPILHRIPLLEPDEGRYAEIPREMLESGDFVTPYLNYVKYFEKPPLLYWLNALSFKIFGLNEFAARLPTVLFAILGILLTYHVGRTLYGRRAGLFSALILGTATGYLVLGRFNVIDMILSVCMGATLGFFLLATRPGEKRAALYYHLFYLCAALTVLAKGLIGIVLPGGVIVLYILLTRRWRLLAEMRLLTGIPLFLLAAAPWFVLVSLRNPEFARFFFIHEHFERFLTKVHGRYEPFWFFIPVLAGGMFPWSFFLPAAAKRLWQQRSAARDDGRLFLFLWAAVIFLFFSASDSKLIPYIFPIFPALAILLGEMFSARGDEAAPTERGVPLLVAALFIIVGIGVSLYPHLVPKPRLGVAESAIFGLIFVAGGGACLAALRQESRLAFFRTLAISSLTVGVVGAAIVLASSTDRKSSRDLGLLARANADGATVIASYNTYQQGFSFYAGRRILLVNEKNELDFGSRQGDQSRWFLDDARFFPLWNSPTRVILLVKKDAFPAFRQKTTLPPRQLGEKEKFLLVTNH